MHLRVTNGQGKATYHSVYSHVHTVQRNESLCIESLFVASVLLPSTAAQFCFLQCALLASFKVFAFAQCLVRCCLPLRYTFTLALFSSIGIFCSFTFYTFYIHGFDSNSRPSRNFCGAITYTTQCPSALNELKKVVPCPGVLIFENRKSTEGKKDESLVQFPNCEPSRELQNPVRGATKS